MVFIEWFCTNFEDPRDGAVLERLDEKLIEWERADICPPQKGFPLEDRLYCRQATGNELFQFVYVPVYSSDECPRPISPGTYRLKYTVFKDCSMERCNASQGRDMCAFAGSCEVKKEIVSPEFEIVDDVS